MHRLIPKTTKLCPICNEQYIANKKHSPVCYKLECRARFNSDRNKVNSKARRERERSGIEYQPILDNGVRPYSTLTVLMLIDAEKHGWSTSLLADMLSRDVADMERIRQEVEANGLLDRVKARVERKQELSEELVGTRRDCSRMAHEWR